MGAWLSYGLGAESQDLPAYVVMTSGVKRQPLLNSYWTSGFLPSEHQGVRFRGQGDPVLFLSSPEKLKPTDRRRQIDLIGWMNRRRYEAFGDPETLARVQQYEVAFRMQTTAPELTDLSGESQATMESHHASEPCRDRKVRSSARRPTPEIVGSDVRDRGATENQPTHGWIRWVLAAD